MKVEEGSSIKCCVCGEDAVERSFDGTGWCQIHLSDWQAFLKWERTSYDSLTAAFNAWLEIAEGMMTFRFSSGMPDE